MVQRTQIQLALLVVGMIVWGYGQRIDDNRLQIIGVLFFAAATILRFFKTREPPPS